MRCSKAYYSTSPCNSEIRKTITSAHTLQTAPYDRAQFPQCRFELSVYCVRFEVFTAVTMKNGVFCVVTPCGSCKNRRFGGTWRLLNQKQKKNSVALSPRANYTD
jgi:hypothetical protein